jgi:hypothetical protein
MRRDLDDTEFIVGADQARVFLGGLGATRKAEKGRLRSEYERAQRVLSEIGAASSTVPDEESA